MVPIICRAGAFRGNHRRAERTLLRTLLSERRTLWRFLQALQNFTGDTKRRLLCENIFYFESFFRIELLELWAQAPTTLRDNTDAAPVAIYRLKYGSNCPLGGFVTLELDSALILILGNCLSRFELLHCREKTVQQINWLEASDDNWHTIFFGNRWILMKSHHRADVTRGE